MGGDGRPQIKLVAMKTRLAAVVSLVFLSSCVFEQPFESDPKIPVDSKLLGLWEKAPEKPDQAVERLLVLQHSANEYFVQYPVGDEAMFFRTYAVELAGENYIQIQLTGTAEGPVKQEERKYHLLKIRLDGDMLELRAIDPDVLGKSLMDSAQMKTAFERHKDDPKLFAEPLKFRRIK